MKVKEAFADQLERVPLTHEVVLKMIKVVCIAVAVYFLTTAKLFGCISGLGFAVVVALPLKLSYLGIISNFVGYMVLGLNSGNGYLLGAAILLTAMKLLAAHYHVRLYKPWLLAFITGTVLFGIAVVDFFKYNQSLASLGLYICQAVIAATVTYYSYFCTSALLSKRLPEEYSKSERYSILILLVLLVTALSGFSIAGLNAGCMLASLAVLIASYEYGCAGGAVAGVLMGAGLVLYAPDQMTFATVLLLSGFLTGLFSQFGKLMTTAVFLAVHMAVVFLYGAPLTTIAGSIATFFACAAFVALPQSFLDWVGELQPSQQSGQKADNQLLRDHLSARFDFASATISDLQKSLTFVSKTIQKMECGNINRIYDHLQEEVCGKCSNKLFCYSVSYDSTLENFGRITEMLKKEGSLPLEKLPPYFSTSCQHPRQLVEHINTEYQRFLTTAQNELKVDQTRLIVSEQFESIADLLGEVSEELQSMEGLDAELSALVKEALFEWEPEQVSCFLDHSKRVYTDIYFNRKEEVDSNVVMRAVQTAIGRELALPCTSQIGGLTKISLFEKQGEGGIGYEFGVSQICYTGNRISGDSYEQFQDSRGLRYFMLSDGMGKGKRAAMDSMMTCSIMEELIKAGFGYESALKMINAALAVRSADESIATIDIARLDLNKQTVELIKAGAAVSFVKSGDMVKKIQAFSLPLGILQGVEYDKKTLPMAQGDILVLLSDGAASGNDEWIAHLIEKNAEKSAQGLAELLCDTAKKTVTGEEDDITVLTFKITAA